MTEIFPIHETFTFEFFLHFLNERSHFHEIHEQCSIFVFYNPCANEDGQWTIELQEVREHFQLQLYKITIGIKLSYAVRTVCYSNVNRLV